MTTKSHLMSFYKSKQLRQSSNWNKRKIINKLGNSRTPYPKATLQGSMNGPSCHCDPLAHTWADRKDNFTAPGERKFRRGWVQQRFLFHRACPDLGVWIKSSIVYRGVPYLCCPATVSVTPEKKNLDGEGQQSVGKTCEHAHSLKFMKHLHTQW